MNGHLIFLPLPAEALPALAVALADDAAAPLRRLLEAAEAAGRQPRAAGAAADTLGARMQRGAEALAQLLYDSPTLRHLDTVTQVELAHAALDMATFADAVRRLERQMAACARTVRLDPALTDGADA